MALITLCLCVILGAVVLMNLEPARAASRSARANNSASTYVVAAASKQAPGEPSSIVRSATPLSARAATIAEADPSIISSIKDLLIPVAGVTPDQLRDSFYDSRSEGRVHEALDIMAPLGTPVLAAVDGAIMKLHQSGRGGIMLYQSDPSGIYVFYYGHLFRYADGISEGQKLKRGDVIGYVGDTGNAGAGNFHLHFGISKMSAAGRWYGGEPVNPYPLLRREPSPFNGR